LYDSKTVQNKDVVKSNKRHSKGFYINICLIKDIQMKLFMEINQISGRKSKIQRLYVFILLNVFYSKNISKGEDIIISDLKDCKL